MRTQIKSTEIALFEDSIFEIYGVVSERNFGVTFLKWRFWNSFCLSVFPLGHKNSRFCFGIGLFEFFFDFPSN